jgi:hypothetical protein
VKIESGGGGQSTTDVGFSRRQQGLVRAEPNQCRTMSHNVPNATDPTVHGLHGQPGEQARAECELGPVAISERTSRLAVTNAPATSGR